MEQNSNFNQDLLRLFSEMIDDKTEKLILHVLFTNNDIDQVVDELIKALEYGQNDKD